MTDIDVAPVAQSERSIYLLDADDEVDERLLRAWVAERHGAGEAGRYDIVAVPHPRAADSAERLASLARLLKAPGDVMLRPLRVAWLAVERDGDRTVRIRDVLHGDPRNPSLRRKRVISRDAPERIAVIVGDAASVAEVCGRRGAPASDDVLERARYVTRLAFLSLERAEYRTRGAQYKVPRLVREDLTESADFRARATALAASLDRDADEVWTEILGCLDEMVTGYSRLFLDLMARLGKRVKRPGYGDEIDYDQAQLERIREVLANHPAVILPSHKSNLDATVIPVVLHENGLPPTHTFAGINMAFWPFGTIFRRAGRIFIRRDIKNDPVYRWVLREYLGYLVEKRFNLEWYVEGTRSRTGKLAPPKLGLLRYIADACREGRADDVAMVPVSIMYDQLDEVREFASEAAGHAKKAETLGWALKFVRSQRGQYGRIYVRFAEPIWLRQAIEESVGDDVIGAEMSEDDIRLQKLAFEVSARINSVTPITGSALLCLVLLATRGRALTTSELRAAVAALMAQSEARGLPLAVSAERLATEEGVRSIAESLAANDTVEAYNGGDEPVYRVGRDHHLAAAFYRNTIVHFFVGGAIAEVALIHAMESDLPADGRTAAFWDEAYRLRDLLKFDFFFEQRERFRSSLSDELGGRVDGWEEQLVRGADPGLLLDQMQPLLAFSVLRPFVEAYLIVATALLDEPPESTIDHKAFTKRCLAVGEQWLRQERVRSPEAVSQHLFKPALKLAEHRGLLTSEPDVVSKRQRLVDELTDIARRIDIVEQRTYDAAGRSLTRAKW